MSSDQSALGAAFILGVLTESRRRQPRILVLNTFAGTVSRGMYVPSQRTGSGRAVERFQHSLDLAILEEEPQFAGFYVDVKSRGLQRRGVHFRPGLVPASALYPRNRARRVLRRHRCFLASVCLLASGGAASRHHCWLRGLPRWKKSSLREICRGL